MEPTPTPIADASPTPAKSSGRDDVAYVAPMAVFLAFTQLGASFPSLYPLSYVAKTVAAAVLLAAFRKRYTPIRWDYWQLGILVGVAGIVQWVPMQLWLEHHFEFFRPSSEAFDPTKTFASPVLMWAFIGVRVADAVLVVPFMEELFWRDYLWRQIDAPNDFKLARVGEWAWGPFLIVAAFFATVHGHWWLTAVVWALMVGGLLVYTKSLGACVVAHGVTNLLLSLYVLRTHDWSFW